MFKIGENILSKLNASQFSHYTVDTRSTQLKVNIIWSGLTVLSLLV